MSEPSRLCFPDANQSQPWHRKLRVCERLGPLFVCFKVFFFFKMACVVRCLSNPLCVPTFFFFFFLSCLPLTQSIQALWRRLFGRQLNIIMGSVWTKPELNVRKSLGGRMWDGDCLRRMLLTHQAWLHGTISLDPSEGLIFRGPPWCCCHPMWRLITVFG